MHRNDYREARKLIRGQFPWSVILDHFRGKYTQQQIEDHHLKENAKMRARHKKNNQTGGKFWVGIIELPDRQIVPKEVLADRDRRRWRDHPELTGRICGDPLPEYSALARRQAG